MNIKNYCYSILFVLSSGCAMDYESDVPTYDPPKASVEPESANGTTVDRVIARRFATDRDGNYSSEVLSESVEAPLPKDAPGKWSFHMTSDWYFEHDSSRQVIRSSTDVVYIQNTSSDKKLHVVGLLTRDKNVAFIDLEQPGSFNITLYPGESKTLSFAGGGARLTGSPPILKIQDWATE